VLWLRPADIAALGDVPAGAATVYLSGLMGGLEKTPLARGLARAHPDDLPARSSGQAGVRLDYPLGWFAFRHIPVVAEQVQTDTYLACSLLADVLNRMADNFARPYLIEQLQALLEHRLITGYYPHLTLASNQRFASKGGYVVHFRNPAARLWSPRATGSCLDSQCIVYSKRAYNTEHRAMMPHPILTFAATASSSAWLHLPA